MEISAAAVSTAERTTERRPTGRQAQVAEAAAAQIGTAGPQFDQHRPGHHEQCGGGDPRPGGGARREQRDPRAGAHREQRDHQRDAERQLDRAQQHRQRAAQPDREQRGGAQPGLQRAAAQHAGQLRRARTDQDGRDDRWLDVPQVSHGRLDQAGRHDGCPIETVALKQPCSRSPPMATKPSIGRLTTRPRGEVPQVTHRSQNTGALAVQPDTGHTQVALVHSLRIRSRLPTDRNGRCGHGGPGSGCSRHAVSGSSAG